MGATSGSLNASGFSQSIKNNQLPDYNHITHAGIINQNYFSIGPKAKDLITIHHGIAVSNSNLYNQDSRNYFISLFLKTSKDGQKRVTPLNIVIVLDVSGSMNGALSYRPNDLVHKRTRLELSRKAIQMFYEKLEPNDCFSLVTFHNSAKTIIKSQFVKNLNKQMIFERINSKFQSGGTTISSGFKEGQLNLKTMKIQHSLSDNYQHRIVMLTDVNDNSVSGEENLIKQISNSGISTTIIGVSKDFKSQTCQKLIKIKGFNYMCAVDDEDLQTYLVDQFDYTFFPCVEDISISMKSQSIQSIKVYGSVDQDITYPINHNSFTITQMKSFFPSALRLDKFSNLQTKGGLILVKFVPKQKQSLPKLYAEIILNYKDFKGHIYEEYFIIDKIIESQVLFSDEAIRKGVSLYYYTQTIRNLLRAMKEGENKLSDENRGFYLDQLNRLKDHCPKEKEQQLKKLCEIVEKKQ